MKVLCKKFVLLFCFSWAHEIQFRAVEVKMVTYQSLQEFQSGSGLPIFTRTHAVLEVASLATSPCPVTLEVNLVAIRVLFSGCSVP